VVRFWQPPADRSQGSGQRSSLVPATNYTAPARCGSLPETPLRQRTARRGSDDFFDTAPLRLDPEDWGRSKVGQRGSKALNTWTVACLTPNRGPKANCPVYPPAPDFDLGRIRALICLAISFGFGQKSGSSSGHSIPDDGQPIILEARPVGARRLARGHRVGVTATPMGSAFMLLSEINFHLPYTA